MAKYVRVNIHTGQRSYLFGDFNHNGVKNIDDPRPFDPNETRADVRKRIENPLWWHKARFSDKDVNLSDELLALEKYNNARLPMVKRFVASNPGSIWRIKSVPSTIRKFRTKHIGKINDIAGARVLTTTRAEATDRFKHIEQFWKHDPRLTDNFYRRPNGAYYAYHLGLVDPGNRHIKLEVQVKSKKMSDLADKMHSDYKHGISTYKYKKQAKRLFDLGF